VLDACAIIAYYKKENGGRIVYDILRSAIKGEARVFMHKINLYEVYYGLYIEYGEAFANAVLEQLNNIELIIDSEITDEIFAKAAYFKIKHGRMSLADSYLLAEAAVRGAKIVTCDHHELDLVERSGLLEFLWIR
jgi:predicted nucleic acid-binding protein